MNAKHRAGCEDVKRVELHLDRKRCFLYLFGFPKSVQGCDIQLLVSLYEQCEERKQTCDVTSCRSLCREEPAPTTSVLI